MASPVQSTTHELYQAPDRRDGSRTDIFQISAATASKTLCNYIESLLVPSTRSPLTPPSSPPRHPVDTRIHETPSHEPSSNTSFEPASPEQLVVPGAQESPVSEQEKYQFDLESIHQSEILARKFFSKHAPPISVEEYLDRMHQFCPSSPAVYLAVIAYIHKLSAVDKVITVTTLSAHRLLLAGLRVATKALEDRNYPNSRFAKVGGVTQPELSRLEISFCFLISFELRVDEEILTWHMKRLSESTSEP